ncbi:MAG: hypothetical protein RBU37_13235 [Myxococcota bacterium]|nr:hypothetical protein [Myxococcota bacterium]
MAARVQVLQEGQPLSGVVLSLAWMSRDGQSLLSWSATSDEQGWARFEAIDWLSASNLSLVASVEDGWTLHRSAPLQRGPDGVTGQLLIRAKHGRREALSVARAVTLLRMPSDLENRPEYYGYVELQQVLQLSVEGDSVFDTSASPQAREGLRLPLPEGASRVDARIRAGRGELELADGFLRFHGSISPEEGLELIIWCALSADGSELDFEQELSLPWQRVEFGVLRETGLSSQPSMQIGLSSPVLSELIEDPQDDPMWVGQRLTLLRGGPLAAGSVLELSVAGLPYSDRHGARLVLIAVLLILGAGGVAVYRSVRKER